MSSSSSTKVIYEHEKIKRKQHSETDTTSINNKKFKANENDDSVPVIEPTNDDDSEQSADEKAREELLAKKIAQVENPRFGQIVNRRNFRRAGPYLIGQKLGHSPVDSIVQYLAKKENSNEFVQLKILMLSNNSQNEKLLQDERQGKMLLHTEFSLLSLLHNQSGVIQQHGMFSDMAFEEDHGDLLTNDIYYTGKVRKRLVLVLDCVTAHDFDEKSSAFVNLQQYLINRKKLPEIEALKIFYEIILVVENLHKHNVIHRDLKLGNIVLNVHSNKIKIINFCLGKYLLNENNLLNDQRGSPAYISPDVLCGQPYKGKPSDMWALGVVLFMMLYRQFPFFESTPAALFKKIKCADYSVPLNSEVSEEAEQIIKGLLQLSPDRRFTATQVRIRLENLLKRNSMPSSDRAVPEFHENQISIVNHPSPTSMSTFLDQYILPRKSSKPRFIKRVSYQLDQIVPVVSNSVLETSEQSRTTPKSITPINILNNSPLARLRVERGQDARHLNLNDIGQLLRPNQINSLSIRNLARSWHDAMHLRNTGQTTSSNSSQVIQQMSNLTLRSRRDTARRTAHDEARGLQNQNSTRSTAANSIDRSVDHYSRYLSRLYRCALLRSTQNRQRAQNMQTATNSVPNGDAAATVSPPTSASSPSSAASAIPNVRAIRDNNNTILHDEQIEKREIQKLFESINQMFVRGRIVSPNAHLQDFNGVITEDLGTKICGWLVREHRRNLLIHSIFLRSTNSPVDKVVLFLRQCGVQLQQIGNVTKIRRRQSINLLMALTCLLHVAGYNNTYFTSD